MFRGSLGLMSVAAALFVAAPALADQAKSVTATGVGVAKVVPKNRHSNSSIATAVELAKEKGIADAIELARERAVEYAAETGLTLGPVISVSDVQSNGVGYPGFGPFGPFGPFPPNHYCGTVRQPVFKVVAGRRTLKSVKRVHRCFVPAFESSTMTVTYSAT